MEIVKVDYSRERPMVSGRDLHRALEIIQIIQGVECYEKDGVVYLRLETVARGLRFTRAATSGNEIIRYSLATSISVFT